MPYDDDEELPPPRPVRPVRLTKHHNSDAPLAANDQKVLLELHGVSAASRAPLDLVAVIDVSASMADKDRLNNTKEALSFITRKLTDLDRLCIVQFNHAATRLRYPLRRVTEAARADFEDVISGLQAGGGTNIEAGLDIGVNVIVGRKFTTGRAAGIIDEN
ncbi:hypothetical protein EJB05_27924, partial [Eragrostis curvula]